MRQIDIKNLVFGYDSEKVIKNCDFQVDKEDLVLIYGVNGSGKSTLIKLILGELKKDSGQLDLLGKDINQVTSFRDIGYVPQVQNLSDIAFPVTVLELVVLNLYEDFGFIKIPKKRHNEKAINLLKNMGLGNYINTPFNELSGGLKQRAMISRALINDPEILILDEPTAGVDEENKIKFLQLVNEMNKEKGITTIIITHEVELVLEYLDITHGYEMKGGRLVDANL